MPEELRMEVHDIVQEAVIKTISKKKKCRKAKLLSDAALEIAEKRETKGKGEKERYARLNAESQRIVISAKKYRKTIEGERSVISSRKLEIQRGYSMQRWAQ